MKKEIVNKKELYELYINKNMSQKELIQKYKITRKKLCNILRKYNIKKSRELNRKNYRKTCEARYKFNEKLLKKYYIEKNYSRKEVCELFNVNEMTLKSWLRKYNIKKNPLLVSKNTQKTMKSKYGENCSMKVKSIRKKFENSMIDKYGTIHPLQNKKILKKMQYYYKEKNGVSNPFQNEEIKKKIQKTNLEKYGVENVMQNKTIMNKAIRTMKKNYGVSYAMQSDTFKKRLYENNLKKWGYIIPSQSKIIINKIRNTNIKKYGGHPMQTKEIHSKLSRYRNIKSKMDDTMFDSSYERNFYDFLKCAGCKNIEMQVAQEYSNKPDKKTLIDFYVQGIFFECKGAHLLKGIYDNDKKEINIKDKLKKYININAVIITDKRGLEILNKYNENHVKKIRYIDNRLFEKKKTKKECRILWNSILFMLENGNIKITNETLV